jgi:hypothetical protein
MQVINWAKTGNEDSNPVYKALPQYLHTALTAKATVHIGKSKDKFPNIFGCSLLCRQ